MDIVVAAIDAAIRERLLDRLAGSDALTEAPNPETLERVLNRSSGGIVVTAARWPEVAPLLDCALLHRRPVAAFLDDGKRGIFHPAFARGASAVLPWDVAPRALSAALTSVAEGLCVSPGRRPTPPRDARPDHSRLSARERDVLELVAAGLPTKQVARKLGLSPNTVKHHVAAIFRKLGSRTRAEAYAAAIRRGELTI